MKTYIIAEAGVNHNGSLAMAMELATSAATAGADAVKFQTFSTDRLVRRNAPKAEYQKQTTGSDETQYDMLRRLELPTSAYRTLLDRCTALGLDFLSSPFDEGSLDFLVDELGLKTVKLSSGELTNGPLLLHAARKGVNVILSTGMGTLAEVETALSCLAFGYTKGDVPPSLASFLMAYADPLGRASLQRHVTLLHCTTEYPAPPGDANLRSMLTMREAFQLPVGYSDHTTGIAVPLAAAALGATVLEKHFTLDKGLPGPDHQASLEPAEFAKMVQAVREVDVALGSGVKMPTPSEYGNRAVLRKSLVAKCALRKGERFSTGNVACKRPGTGVSPFSMWEIEGREAHRDYAEDDLLEE